MIPYRPYNIKYFIHHKHYTFIWPITSIFNINLCCTVVYLFQSLRLNKNETRLYNKISNKINLLHSIILPTATGDRILFLLVFFYKGT